MKHRIIKLKYGNTNTYLVNNLLIDTDGAGTLPAFFREIKKHGIALSDIRYVLATHYHPDHMGLIGDCTALGIHLLLFWHQMDFVHTSDAIFQREPRVPYQPIDERHATVIHHEESRTFLHQIGIQGEVLPTKSHRADGIALVLDDGNCFVGDLEPVEYLHAYDENPALQEDWNRILSHHPTKIHYGHAPEMLVR